MKHGETHLKLQDLTLVYVNIFLGTILAYKGEEVFIKDFSKKLKQSANQLFKFDTNIRKISKPVLLKSNFEFEESIRSLAENNIWLKESNEFFILTVNHQLLCHDLVPHYSIKNSISNKGHEIDKNITGYESEYEETANIIDQIKPTQWVNIDFEYYVELDGKYAK